jgi:hypothetical protein
VTIKVMVQHVRGCVATAEQTLASVREHGDQMAAENLLTVQLDPVFIQQALVRNARGRLITVDVYEIMAHCSGSL